MKTNETNGWRQSALLRNADGKAVCSYSWDCSEGDESNVDGFSDAMREFAKSFPEFERVNDEEYDDVFDACVIDGGEWSDGTFSVSLDPVGKL